eukprot:GHVU01028482.1.p3 GENE.GHVU01028482.1~~GHVU01028482.1.p3  ORF type:complete len:120 (+),score=12.16 GHVU01028482.1:1199-1558(+)
MCSAAAQNSGCVRPTEYFKRIEAHADFSIEEAAFLLEDVVDEKHPGCSLLCLENIVKTLSTSQRVSACQLLELVKNMLHTAKQVEKDAAYLLATIDTAVAIAKRPAQPDSYGKDALGGP